MERTMNKKIETYIGTFKDKIRDKISELGLDNSSSGEMNSLIQFVYDYERLIIDKDDFTKRKRIKNSVSYCDRCCAKRANGEQCTRRKKDGFEHCGTHLKGTPHGIIDADNEQTQSHAKVSVWAQDIHGIMYYIDDNENVYQMEDVMENKHNPKVIAKYTKVGDTYSIVDFGL